MSSERDLATSFLNRLCNGETTVSADLFPLVYEQLRAIASSLLQQERADHTLQPTALVHEAYLRLVDLKNVDSDDSENVHAHFVAISARAMRRILVEHARGRGRIKRGGIRQRLTIDESLQGLQGLQGLPAQSTSLIDLEDALKKLEAIDPRLVRAAELRIFGGLSVREMAPCLNLSLTRAKVVWASARAMLSKLMDEADAAS